MRSLTAHDAISIWEQGHRQRPAERAVAVLSAAFPEAGREELGRLSLGQCNAFLWDARKRIFGSACNGFSECTACGERLEFTFDTEDLRADGPPPANEFELESNGYHIRFRLLDVEDLKVAAAGAGIAAVRQRLVESCVLAAHSEDRSVPATELPNAVIQDLGNRLAESDAGAEVILDLSCPACNSTNRLPFDPATFFYAEISAQAQRLLREVHVLAGAYGWQEADILGMSARRRQFYLECLEAMTDFEQ